MQVAAIEFSFVGVAAGGSVPEEHQFGIQRFAHRKGSVMRFVRRIVALSSVAIVGGTLLTLPASAATDGTSAIKTFRRSYSELCLDGSVSQGVNLKACNSASNYQKWDEVGGALKSRADLTKCLDASASQGVSVKPCNGSTYQQWYHSDAVDVRHRQTGYCLDGSVSQGVTIKPCVAQSIYQIWYF